MTGFRVSSTFSWKRDWSVLSGNATPSAHPCHFPSHFACAAKQHSRGLVSRHQLAPEPLLTASWEWCPIPVRREWPWAPPWQPTVLSALCTHWYSEPLEAGSADGPREPAASARRGPGLDPDPGLRHIRNPRPSRRLQPPPPPWLPPCAAARDRWARVKGRSERHPARPFAEAHPSSHRGAWSFISSAPAHRARRPPQSRLGRCAPAEQVSSTCHPTGPARVGLDQEPNHKRPEVSKYPGWCPRM